MEKVAMEGHQPQSHAIELPGEPVQGPTPFPGGTPAQPAAIPAQHTSASVELPGEPVQGPTASPGSSPPGAPVQPAAVPVQHVATPSVEHATTPPVASPVQRKPTPSQYFAQSQAQQAPMYPAQPQSPVQHTGTPIQHVGTPPVHHAQPQTQYPGQAQHPAPAQSPIQAAPSPSIYQTTPTTNPTHPASGNIYYDPEKPPTDMYYQGTAQAYVTPQDHQQQPPVYQTPPPQGMPYQTPPAQGMPYQTPSPTGQQVMYDANGQPMYQQQPQQYFQPMPGQPMPGQQIPMQQMPGQGPQSPQTHVAAQPAMKQGTQYQNATPVAALGRGAAPVDCPACGQRAMTQISYEIGNTTHAWALGLCCLVCLGCIPYVMNSLKDVQHKCGRCGVLLATWHRSGTTEVHIHS